MSKLIAKQIACSECGGRGIYDSSSEDQYGVITHYRDKICSTCKGKKTFGVSFIVTGEPCNARVYSHEMQKKILMTCENGTLHAKEPFYQYGTNILGQTTRKLINNYTKRCELCFGTGQKHHIAKKVFCPQCKGNGTITERRWGKSFFGGEVEKEYSFKCPACNGNKFSWQINREVDFDDIRRASKPNL